MPSPQQGMGWDQSSSNQAPEKRALRVQGARQACQWVGIWAVTGLLCICEVTHGPLWASACTFPSLLHSYRTITVPPEGGLLRKTKTWCLVSGTHHRDSLLRPLPFFFFLSLR